MAWREVSIVSQRLEFVALAAAEGSNIRGLCRRFGISPQTGYKWMKRHREQGAAGLADRSRRPRGSPSRTDAMTEATVVALRDRHPAWGGRKLRARLVTLGHAGVPAPSTITAVLRRHGRIDEAASPRHTAFTRFERAAPNELWQMDYKGHVPMRAGGRCHPLTILDDHSRFSIGLFACDNERGETVKGHLTAVFRRYGLPQRMLADNGSPWGVSHALERYTKLEVWLLRLGVVLSHGRPMHPQTQGKDERFHRTLNVELLSRMDLLDLAHSQSAFDAWRDVYNLERPSEAIGMAVPASRYRPSPRVFPETLPPVEYGPDDAVRRVKRDGSFKYRDRMWYIGDAFAGEWVGVRPGRCEGELEVRYGPYLVGTVDTLHARSAVVVRGLSHAGPPLAALAPAPHATTP